MEEKREVMMDGDLMKWEVHTARNRFEGTEK